MMDRLRDLLALSDLARWNVVPTSRTQSVAQHSYRVAVISREIFDLFNKQPYTGRYKEPEMMLEIIEWAMDHDGPECVTGDLSSAFKDSIPDDQLALIERTLCPWYDQAQQVSDLTRAVVAIADAVEASAWLSIFGLTGTEPLVADLRQKALIRCDRADVKWPGLGKAGRDVAIEVWRNKFPLILRKDKYKDKGEVIHAAGSGTENGRDTTNHGSTIESTTVTGTGTGAKPEDRGR